MAVDGLILTINPSSSSRSFSLYEAEREVGRGYYESHDGGYERTVVRSEHMQRDDIDDSVFSSALADFLGLMEVDVAAVKSVALRIVAPGRKFMMHQRITHEFEAELSNSVELAPLHLSTALSELNQVRELLGAVPVYAISDSAFHSTLSHEARNYAIPRQHADSFDVYRFGYHGTSLQSVVSQFGDAVPEKMIICHLGSGASVTALLNGKSLDTSMGYSPLEGLVMATRSGSIDVEAALRIKKQLGLDDDGIVHYLNTQSGLLGLSEHSNDIRTLLELEPNNANAKLALDSMVYRITQYIGAYYATLGGLHELVFTATVGERSDVIRERICQSVEQLGIKFDPQANSKQFVAPGVISDDTSAIRVSVIPANEAKQMAHEARKLGAQ